MTKREREYWTRRLWEWRREEADALDYGDGDTAKIYSDIIAKVRPWLKSGSLRK
jgi:hypothetical protein